jgi:transcriptional regulator with PAS, ATPase and Fis domain
VTLIVGAHAVAMEQGAADDLLVIALALGGAMASVVNGFDDHAIAGITLEAVRALQNYSWPGNVRELGAEIERLVLYADEGGYITLNHLSPRILPVGQRAISGDEKSQDDLEHLLEDYERRVITEMLKRHDGNVARATLALGLGSRQTLYKKLKRLAIDIGDFLQEDTEPGLQLRAERH